MRLWFECSEKLMSDAPDYHLDLFEHIIKAEEVGGFTRGRRENALFVPNVYRADQESKLCQFVASNDYIGKGFNLCFLRRPS